MSGDAVKKAYFLRAVILVHEAIINFSHRYADLADELASKEADVLRKKDLERIAETCRWVPENPARTFYEALQSLWFMYAIYVTGTSPFGRFDQYMYPFYKADKEAGKITDEEVLELLQCLRIKDMTVNFTFGGIQQRQKWAGLAKWNNMVIGGVTRTGEDATNELSYLILEAAIRCPTPHHTITLRVHESTPEKLMVKALEVVKTGIGMPAFVSDKSFIEYFLTAGVPLDLARDYYIIGCLDGNVPEGCATLFGMFIAPRVLEIFMHDGFDSSTGKQLAPKIADITSFESFEDLMEAFKKTYKHMMGLHIESDIIRWGVATGRYTDALGASLFTNGIRDGKVRAECMVPYQMGATINSVGWINVADSLAAIKKLVFDDKKVTMKELNAALDANWQGERNQEIRKMCLAAPKFGNDNDYVDLIARDLYDFYAEAASTFQHPRGTKYTVGAISITSHGPGGAVTGATPDGRYAGDTLADGSMSPAQGKDTHGPLATVKSAAKINQVPYQSTLFNMKFHTSALKTTEDLRKLSMLIKTYFKMGGKQVQFNVVNREKLIKAQEQPDQHRDLVVRVAGYSAYFVQLTPAIQNEIIGRTEHITVA